MLYIVHRTGIHYPFGCEMFIKRIHAFQERSPVFLFRLCPCHFRQCRQAWEYQIIHILRLITELCPHTSLYAHQQIRIFRFPVFLNRLIVIHIFQRIIAEIRQRLKPLRSLITNQVHDACGSHDEAMSLLGSLQCSLSVSLPTQNNGIVRQKATVRQLIPAYHLAPFATYIFAHPIHEITLQILFIGNLLLFHPCLTQRAFLPISFTGFIATDMDISGREQFQNLIHHILKKGIDTVISGTIDDLGISSSQTGEHSDIFLHHRTS